MHVRQKPEFNSNDKFGSSWILWAFQRLIHTDMGKSKDFFLLGYSVAIVQSNSNLCNIHKVYKKIKSTGVIIWLLVESVFWHWIITMLSKGPQVRVRGPLRKKCYKGCMTQGSPDMGKASPQSAEGCAPSGTCGAWRVCHTSHRWMACLLCELLVVWGGGREQRTSDAGSQGRRGYRLGTWKTWQELLGQEIVSMAHGISFPDLLWNHVKLF